MTAILFQFRNKFWNRHLSYFPAHFKARRASQLCLYVYSRWVSGANNFLEVIRMSNITIEMIQTKQAELAEMIQQLKVAQSESLRLPKLIRLPETKIALEPNEHYAGLVLDCSAHHLVLMAKRPDTKLTWQEAMYWASSVGGRLPDTQELALLYANCKQYLEPKWYWSCEDDKSITTHPYALGSYFDNGQQSANPQNHKGLAVAVRIITVED